MSLPNMSSQLYSYFNKFRLENKFYDIIIKVGDRSFHCHRIILASAFKYFRNIFFNNFEEADKDEIEIKGINADDFELLLTHVYGGEVSLVEENVYSLLKLANILCLPTLEDTCVKYLSDNVGTISSSTAVDIFIFASKIGQTVLLEKFAGYLAENFENVVKNEKFCRVFATDLMKILKHSNLKTKSLLVLEFLGEWVQFQSDEDEKLLPELLSAVKLREVPKEWFVKIQTSRNNRTQSSDQLEILNNIGQPSEMINAANSEKVMNFERDIFIDEARYDDKDTISCRQGCNTKLPFTLYALETKNQYCWDFVNFYQFENYNEVQPLKLSTIENFTEDCFLDKYSKDNSTLTILNSGRGKLQFGKSLFMNQLHYLVLMNEDAAHFDYDTKAKKTVKIIKKHHLYSSYICHELKQRKKLPTYEYDPKREDTLNPPAITACGSNIYLYTDGELIMLDGGSHEWNKLRADHFHKTTHPNLVSYADNSIYLIGGKFTSNNSSLNLSNSALMSHLEINGKLFQHSDIRTRKWDLMPTPTYSRNKSASYIHGDTLYVSGGEDAANFKGHIECFDFKAGKWYDLKTSMPEPKFNHTLLVYDDRLWFFGGQKFRHNEIVEDLTWYSYNLKENIWSDISSMPASHNGFTVKRILDVIVKT